MDSSPLSRLPLELREQIYDLVLCGPDHPTITLSAGRPQLLRRGSSHALCLAQTCSLLRYETLPIFFRGNRFVFHTDHIKTFHKGYGLRASWRDCLASWVDTIGDSNRRQLRDVDIDIEQCDPHIVATMGRLPNSSGRA